MFQGPPCCAAHLVMVMSVRPSFEVGSGPVMSLDRALFDHQSRWPRSALRAAAGYRDASEGETCHMCLTFTLARERCVRVWSVGSPSRWIVIASTHRPVPTAAVRRGGCSLRSLAGPGAGSSRSRPGKGREGALVGLSASVKLDRATRIVQLDTGQSRARSKPTPIDRPWSCPGFGVLDRRTTEFSPRNSYNGQRNLEGGQILYAIPCLSRNSYRWQCFSFACASDDLPLLVTYGYLSSTGLVLCIMLSPEEHKRVLRPSDLTSYCFSAATTATFSLLTVTSLPVFDDLVQQ